MRVPAEWDASPCYFMPWVGPAYENGAVEGLRILVLGESHYRFSGLEPHRERQLTGDVIDDELSGRMRHRFISRVTTALFGRAAVEDRDQFRAYWNRMAFYNYVQEFAGDGPRQRPTEQAWAQAAAPFRWLLAELQPDMVLACGRALYERLKRVDGLTSEPLFGDERRRSRSRVLEIGQGRQAVVGMIYHPAAFGFRMDEWPPHVRHYWARAAEVKSRNRGV